VPSPCWGKQGHHLAKCKARSCNLLEQYLVCLPAPAQRNKQPKNQARKPSPQFPKLTANFTNNRTALTRGISEE